jgi:hypothetical protein
MANLERPASQHNEPDRIIGRVRKSAHEDIVVATRTFKNLRYVDLRVMAQGPDGTPLPTKKGVAIRPEAVPGIIELLRQAHSKAVEAGWCDASDKL